MWSRFLNGWALVLSLIVLGCSSSPVRVPETLESRIDKNLTFTDMLASPESYSGRLILLGGEILKAKRLKEGTQVELLQLPLNQDQEPPTDLTPGLPTVPDAVPSSVKSLWAFSVKSLPASIDVFQPVLTARVMPAMSTTA